MQLAPATLFQLPQHDFDIEAQHPKQPGENEPEVQRISPYWGSIERSTVTIYEITAGTLALAGVVAIIEGILLKDPYILSAGIIITTVAGGGALLAHRYRLLKNTRIRLI